jgi:GT2 family glycosyltransferase
MNVIMPVWIHNYETLALTKNAIESLGIVNLIIVDNGSDVGGGYLRSVANTYIRNCSNLGYAKAVNEGLKLASGLVAVSNNDIQVSPNWQEVCTEVLKDKNTYSCHPRMTNYDIPFEYGNTTVLHGKERWCTGSFFVLDRSKLDFLYDENFLNSYDDWDMWYRVRKGGFNTAYTDKCCYQHHHSFTQVQIPEREENNKKNAEYFKTKWGATAEELFEQMYPEQMNVPYEEGFKL